MQTIAYSTLLDAYAVKYPLDVHRVKSLVKELTESRNKHLGHPTVTAYYEEDTFEQNWQQVVGHVDSLVAIIGADLLGDIHEEFRRTSAQVVSTALLFAPLLLQPSLPQLTAPRFAAVASHSPNSRTVWPVGLRSLLLFFLLLISQD